MASSSSIIRGRAGEDTAACALARKGYTILCRNWRFGRCELDIICEKDGEIVFVEVKTRRNHAKGGGPGAITRKKRENIIRTAEHWLQASNNWQRPCRFDVICLYGSEPELSLEHYKNAFLPTLDSSDSNWQSW